QTARVMHVGIESEAGHHPDYWTVDTPLKLTFRIFNYRPDLPLYFNFHLYNQEGVCIFNTASERRTQGYGLVEAVCRIPGRLLNDNTYTVTFMANYRGTTGIMMEDALVFDIHDVGREGLDDYGKWIGATRPKLDWAVRAVGGALPERSVLPHD
ncbi:MAG TPA: hypothetical protein VIU38_14890, partial [Anaerolineales bacterium]